MSAKLNTLGENWMSQLNEREEGIMHLLLQVGTNSRAETYITGNTKIFMRNVKSFIKKNKIQGPTQTFQPTLSEVLRTIKKLEKIGMMKIDKEGLPKWGYQDFDKIIAMINQ